jgi:outer membrane protein
MKKCFVFLAMVVSLGLASLSAYADVKVAVVDMQQVVQNTPQFGEITASLRKEFGDRQKKITDAQNSLKKAADDFNRNSSVMTAADRKTTEEKLMTQQRELQQMQMSFQKDFVEAQNKKINELVTQVKKVVADIAKKDKYNVVLVRAGVIYSDDGMDVTKEVVDALKK